MGTLILLNILGGLALLVLGIRFLRKGLDRLLGDRLPIWIARMTTSPIRSAATGMAVGTIGPSSTALSLVSMSLAQDRYLSLKRGFAFLLGAYVGITVMVQLIAFDITKQAPVLVFFGVLGFLGSRRQVVRGLGQIVLALGIIFLGIGIMQSESNEIAGSEDLREFLSLASGYPWLLALSAIIVTVLLQSSTATIALIMSVAAGSEGMVDMKLALPAIVGANVGISITALLAGWKRVESRRMGLGVVLCRVVLGGAVLFWSALIVESMQPTPGTLSRQMAMAHTAFNLLVVLMSFPLLGPLAWLMTRIVPEAPLARGASELMRLDPRWSGEPTVAFALTRRQIGMMAQLVSQMLNDSWRALKTGDEHLRRLIREQDDLVDQIDRDVKIFLTRELTGELTDEQARIRIDQLRFATDLERIADTIERDLVDLARKKQETGLRFSDEGWLEIKELFDLVRAMLPLAEAVFVEGDRQLAARLLEQKERIRDAEMRLRVKHYERLQSGQTESLETTGMHLEAIGLLKQIGHMASGVAHAVLGRSDSHAEDQSDGQDGTRAEA